jgi:mannosyltransferase
MPTSDSASSTQSHTSGWLRLLVLVLLALAFALRLHELTRQNLWWDEARNLDVALRPFAQIATAPELDIQPPLYYWLLHIWLNIAGLDGTTDPIRLAYVARWLSVAAGLVSTALLYPLARLVFTPAAGLFALTIAALSPFWLAESQEARMYTLGFAWLTAAAVALLSAHSADHRTQSAVPDHGVLVTFVLFAALALWTHYNAIFILVSWFVWWGLWALRQPDRWRVVRTVMVCGLGIGLLLTPLIPIALRQIPTYANPNLTIPTIQDYLWQNWRAYLGGYAFDAGLLRGNGVIWLWLVLVVLIVGVVRGASTRMNRSRTTHHAPRLPHATLLLVWVIGGLALYYVAVLDRGAFNVRYSSLITPALYGLLGGAIAAWGRWWRPLAVAGLAVVIVGLVPAARADLYDPRVAREDIAGVTGWLRTVAGPADLILVDQKYPFGFYYERYTVDPAATPIGPEAAPARYLFVDINTLDQQLNRWAGEARQIFWVQWFESDTDPRHAVPFLLDKIGQRVGSQSFQGYSIDWWVLEPPNHFTLAPAWTPLHVRFPPAAETVAVSLPTEPIVPGQGVPVVIRWRRLPGEITRPYKVRVALYDGNDARLAQSDERLLNDRHLMPAEWRPEDEPLNVYFLPTAADLAPGLYTLRLLVYDAETLEPLTLVDDAGNPAGQEATLGAVEVQVD